MNKGFTLIELLVVIAIIGILSAVVLASVDHARTVGLCKQGDQKACSQLSDDEKKDISASPTRR